MNDIKAKRQKCNIEKYKWMKVACLLFFFHFSCTYEKMDPVKDCALPQSISFKKDILPLINAHCSYAGCHSGLSAAGNFDVADTVAYKNLWHSGSGYIDTLNPSFSLFYAQLKSTSNPMPPSGKLDDCKLQMILKWIEQGAKDN